MVTNDLAAARMPKPEPRAARWRQDRFALIKLDGWLDYEPVGASAPLSTRGRAIVKYKDRARVRVDALALEPAADEAA